jgi:uncharacterized membrane protein
MVRSMPPLPGMKPTVFLTLAFAIGVVAGLRTFTAPMVVSWAARLKWVDLQGTWTALLGGPVVPLLFTVLAAGELVSDPLPKTPSRKAPVPFAARVVSGAFCGAALATGVGEAVLLGAASGALGAVVGTLGGYEARTRLVKALKVPDIAVAIPEDIVAVVGGFLVVALVFFR